jgi:hypothetical protein
MFTFEESGAGDFMTVKNPLTNDEITISLDNWTSEKDNEEARILRGYLSLNMKFPEYSTTTYNWNKATKELEDIDPTDWQAYTAKSNEVKRLNAEREAILAKMRATASTNKYASYAISKMRGINTLEFDASDLTVGKLRLEEKKKEAQEFNDKVTSGEIDLSIPENVEFVNNINDQYNKEIQKDTDILVNKQTNLKNQAADIEEIAGGAMTVAENRGGFLSGVARSASRGAAQPLEYIARMGGFEQADAGEIASQLFYNPTTIDDEYLASEDRTLFEKGVFGVVESVAAAASGSVLTGGMGGVTVLGAKIGVGSMFGMYSMSYNGMIEEMNSPEFKDIPESQKRLFSSIYGWTVGLLEEFGISKIFSKSPVGKNAIKYIMQKTGRELPKDASNEVLERAIRSNINYAIANGIINVGGASVVEGAVEASQTIAEIGLKEAFELTTGREGQFDTDALWAGLPESFKVGLVGGATFNGITQLTQLPSDIYNAQSIKAMDKIVSDPELFPMYKQYVKSRILNGEITKEEAKKSIDVLGQVSAKLNKIPDNISDDTKYEAYLLLDEKEKLQKEIEEKDKALSSAQQNRINQIDEQLKTISENAVQEQAEVSEVSEEVEEGAPAAEPQVVTEEGKKEVVSGVEITYPTEQQKEERIAERTNPTYVEESANKLQEEDVDVLSKELEGEFGLLTAENPMAQPLTEQENTSLNEKAIEWLESRGYKPRRVTGKYGQAENSFFVPDLTRDDAIAFAKEFNQESVAHSDGLVYQDGSINPRVKEQDDFSFGNYSPDSDYVSVVKTRDGLKTFSVGYNFDEKISPQPTANQITVSNELEFIQQADEKHVKTVKAAGRVVKALEKLGVKVFLHKTTDEYNQGISH